MIKIKQLRCRACGLKCKDFVGLISHIRLHKYNSKLYYDSFFKTKNDGICEVCGKNTTYLGIQQGYSLRCSFKCSNSCDKKIKKCKHTNKIKYGNENYVNIKKRKVGLLKKYGVGCVFQLDFVKKRIHSDETNKKRNETVSTPEYKKKIRKFRESKKLWIPLKYKSGFEIYKMSVINETELWKKQLFNSWDGRCYYTNKKLLTDSKNYNNLNYRTIDHRISIFEGFIKKMDSRIIGNINNLCICSRKLNSIKNTKEYNAFIRAIKK